MNFDSQSYAIRDKNRPIEVYLLIDYPDEFDNDAIFPFQVNVLEMDGTAIGKSLIVNMHTNLSIAST